MAIAADGIASFGSSAAQGGTPTDTRVPGFGNRAAIAVLPFRPSGQEPQQNHLADGITEDLIVALARWRSFPVITRNSVFALKSRVLDPREVGHELGARYVVEGQIRSTGTRLRATTQLLDVETGRHLSVEQYDYVIADLFSVQDEMVRDIVGALEPELLKNEQERAIQFDPMMRMPTCFISGLSGIITATQRKTIFVPRTCSLARSRSTLAMCKLRPISRSVLSTRSTPAGPTRRAKRCSARRRLRVSRCAPIPATLWVISQAGHQSATRDSGSVDCLIHGGDTAKP